MIQNIIFAALFIHTAHYIGSVVPASCIMVPSVGEGSLCCMDMKIPHKIDGTLQGEAIRFWIAQLIYSLALQQSQCMHTTLESLTFPRPHFLSIRPLSLSRSTHTHTHIMMAVWCQSRPPSELIGPIEAVIVSVTGAGVIHATALK